MAQLSRKKFNLEVQSNRSLVVRARIQLCRKLITYIKKLSKKSSSDENKNEKNSRKVTRLKDELHCLRNLKPNAISAFALSHTVESCELLRDKPGIESRTRALAKLSLHKLIKPIVEEFHKKYPNWEKELSNLANGSVNKNDIKINSEQTVSGSVNTSDEEECEVSGSDEEEESSVEEMSNSDSNEDNDGNNQNIESDKKISENILLKEVNNNPPSLASPMNSQNRPRMKDNMVNKTKSKLKFQVEGEEVSIKEEEIISSRIRPKKEHAENKWLVKPVEDSMDNSEIKDSEEIETSEEFNNSSDDSEDDENNLSKSEEENSHAKLNGESKNINSVKTEDELLVESNNSTKKERKLSSLLADEDRNERVSVLENNQKVNEYSGEEITVKHELVRGESIGRKLEIPHPKLSEEPLNTKPISKQELKEDPFFLTKDNQKYMTYGKIVEEPKELPLENPKRLDSEKSHKSWNDKSFFNKTRGNDKKWKNDQRPGKRKSLPEQKNIVLHPSWEAKRKVSTILPFQGKKITFD